MPEGTSSAESWRSVDVSFASFSLMCFFRGKKATDQSQLLLQGNTYSTQQKPDQPQLTYSTQLLFTEYFEEPRFCKCTEMTNRTLLLFSI